MANTNKLFNWRNNAIKFVDKYRSIILEYKRKTAEGEETKSKPELSKQKTKHKKSPLKLHEKFINETKHDEKNISKTINYIMAIKLKII